MMQYSFILKDNNQKVYNLFTWFLFFLHIVAAAVVALKYRDSNAQLSVYILLGFYAVISIAYFFFRRHKKALETFSLIMALLYGNFWLKHVGVIALFIFVLVYLFVTIVHGKKTAVLFSEKGLLITRVFKSILYPWHEMDNVILKDNLLTIDFKSNRIIQAEIVEGSEVVDEKNFNGFCTAQLQQLT
jgi:uncharacterized membrane protein YobD (UPF0266 family)